jgi:hypothetical protein
MPLVRGRVVDEQGHPAAGARIMIVSGPQPAPDIALLADGAGQFALAFPAPGTWRLLAATDTGSGEASVTLAPGAAAADLVINLS